MRVFSLADKVISTEPGTFTVPSGWNIVLKGRTYAVESVKPLEGDQPDAVVITLSKQPIPGAPVAWSDGSETPAMKQKRRPAHLQTFADSCDKVAAD